MKEDFRCVEDYNYKEKYNRELKRVARSIKRVHSLKNPLSDVLGIEDR